MEEARSTAAGYLAMIPEETRFKAWKNTSPEYGRRISLGAILFGKRLDDALAEAPPKLVYEQDVQRFLMRLMNEVIEAFAASEDLSTDEAASFLGDVDNRDRIFEFNEVIETYESSEDDVTLEVLLLGAVRDRKERALWADHWTSG